MDMKHIGELREEMYKELYEKTNRRDLPLGQIEMMINKIKDIIWKKKEIE